MHTTWLFWCFFFSFTFCYEAVYGKLIKTTDGGVPLEHLLSCVTGVNIRIDHLGVKKVIWQGSLLGSPNPSLYGETMHSGEYIGREGGMSNSSAITELYNALIKVFLLLRQIKNLRNPFLFSDFSWL